MTVERQSLEKQISLIAVGQAGGLFVPTFARRLFLDLER